MLERDNTSATACPACLSPNVSVFFEMRNVPAYVNFLYKTRDEATECARGDIALAVCRDCGLISNVAFDPARLAYGEGYENSLHCSGTFQKYAESLADRLIEEFQLRGKTVVEIGCGSGEFLSLLCERGDNRGIGFDPSYTGPKQASDLSERVEIIRDYYTERFSDIQADFVCCRHTLEHIRNPFELLRPLRASLAARTDTPVFFEVPNGSYTLRHCFIWDIIYEHTSYFTDQSLRGVFESAGFRVARTYEAFDGQYLCIEAFCGNGGVAGDEASMRARARDGLALSRDIQTFEASHQTYIDGWKKEIGELEAMGKKVVLWGAGSKGVTFLNMLDRGGLVDCVVDMNPKKHGMFVAGTGQKIVSPERLGERKPDVLIIVNPIYRDEIEGTVRALGVETTYLVL